MKKVVRPRLRILFGGDIALGPGKIELLNRLEETGSIAEAARQIGMSYMRAWTLIRTMNRCFKKPLVVALRGGAAGGGAKLTETGRKVMALYQRMESDSLRAAEPRWREMTKLLRD